MEYHGKLYGKIGNKYFDTDKTSQDFDDMTELIQLYVDAVYNEDIVIIDNIENDSTQSFSAKFYLKAKQLLTKITEL